VSDVRRALGEDGLSRLAVQDAILPIQNGYPMSICLTLPYSITLYNDIDLRTHSTGHTGKHSARRL
jgi:hypothetical protein